MTMFHNVNIYRGSTLTMTSTRLEMAAMSPVLRRLMASMNICDGCNEATTIIFPAEDETENTLQEVFKPLVYSPGSSQYSIIECKFCKPLFMD